MNLFSFLEKILGKGKYNHNTKESEFFCCWCFHYKKKLAINIETQKWHCWVCDKRGTNLFPLIKKTGSNADLKSYIELFKPKNVSSFSFHSAEKQEFKIELPKNFKPLINCLDTLYGKRIMAYLENKRGITKDDVLFYKIGICFDGLLENRVIFPSFNADGVLNFYTTRYVDDKHFMKHWSPSVPNDYKINQIFNELYVDWSKSIVLTEGFVDFIKCENAIPLLGSELSEKYRIFQKIVNNGLPVYLAFDSDAFKKTNRIAELFLNYDIDVFVVDVLPFKDCGEMTKEQFLEKKAKAVLYSRQLIFKNKLRMLK